MSGERVAKCPNRCPYNIQKYLLLRISCWLLRMRYGHLNFAFSNMAAIIVDTKGGGVWTRHARCCVSSLVP